MDSSIEAAHSGLGRAYLGTYIGYTHAVSGRRGEALSILETLKQRYEKGIGSPYDIAVIYAGLREKDLSLQWLDKVEQDRSGALLLLKEHPTKNPDEPCGSSGFLLIPATT